MNPMDCNAPTKLAPEVKDIGFDVIAMAKKTSKIHYRYQGRMQDVKAIYQQNTKRRGRSKYLLSVEAEAVVKDGRQQGNSCPLCLCA